MGTMRARNTQNIMRKKAFMKRLKKLKHNNEILSKLWSFTSNPFKMERRKTLQSKISLHLSIN